MADGPGRRVWLLAMTCAVFMLLILSVWGGAVIQGRIDEFDTYRRAERDSSNLARIIAEQTARVIDDADHRLLFLCYEVARFGVNSLDLGGLLSNIAVGSDPVIQLSYININGSLVQSTVERIQGAIVLSDREHFLVHKEGRVSGLFISRPVFGRASGRWSVQLSRRISLSDGGFGGVVVASIDPFYFGRIFDSVNVGRDGIIAIIGRDGFLRARTVMDEAMMGMDVTIDPLFAAASTKSEGFLKVVSPFDNVLRLISFHSLPTYPLLVIVGFAENEFMAETQIRKRILLYGAGGMTILMLGAGVLVMRQRRIQECANANLERVVLERTAEVRQSLTDLRDAQARAQQSQKMASLGVLAGGIAHEINTPIQFIGDNLTFIHESLDELKSLFMRGGISRAGVTLENNDNSVATEDLSFEELIGEISEAIQESLGGIGRVRDTVRAIKMFSHPGDVTLAPRNPATLIETVIAVSRSAWKRAASLDVEIEPNLPFVLCHASDIDQVLLALVMNAAEAIEEQIKGGMGTITIGARQIDQSVEFSVTDNGCGIPDNIREKIWELFFTTKPAGRGSGQGLAISYNIVTVIHGGTIGYENAVGGQGTRFFFTLPIKSDQDISAL